jgi:hypothetical protein
MRIPLNHAAGDGPGGIRTCDLDDTPVIPLSRIGRINSRLEVRLISVWAAARFAYRRRARCMPLATVDAMRVELLYWAGCPSTGEAVELLEEVLAGRAKIAIREVRTMEEAERLAFPGSPTIRIDGRDVDENGARSRPALNCRIYHLTDGRVSPVPSREQLEEALR